MKKIILFTFIISLLYGCPYEYYGYRSSYKPILMERTSLENSISFREAMPLQFPGKIYFKDSYIYINEKYSGVHIINNANPSKPINEGFITVPGSIDMAMKGDILYVDNAVDLIAIDLVNKQVTSRTRNIFPELIPPDKRSIDSKYLAANRPKNTVIVGWQKIN